MIRKIPNETPSYHFYNANPKGKRTGDCVVRAISAATGKTWEEVLQGLTEIALKFKLMPNDDKCYSRYLESFGWKKEKQPRKDDNTKYTGSEFCELLDSENCEYILPYQSSTDTVIAKIGGHHIVCIKIHDYEHRGAFVRLAFGRHTVGALRIVFVFEQLLRFVHPLPPALKDCSYAL